ncbi:MAG: glycosyltransferase [Bacteroidota bacterium]
MNEPVVFQALPKWDAAYNSTSLTVAKLLSRKRKVFYIEHPFSWVDTIRSHTKTQRLKRVDARMNQPFEEFPDFTVIHPPYILPINALSEGIVYRALLKQYQQKLWKNIDQVLTDQGISSFGYVNSFDPVFFSFQSRLNCLYKIYHCVDLIEGESYIAKHGVRAEKEACAQSDFVITTSEPLRRRLSEHTSRVECIPNAADFNHFSVRQNRPPEFKEDGRLKMVYTGSIGHRIDYAFLMHIAQNNPEAQLYLVGPTHPTYYGGGELELLDNVHVLGPRSYEVLPAYIQHADVLLIPFLKNELTHHIYPLKINEYLSTGKPIVTTRFSDLSGFNDLITIDDEFDSPAEAIHHAVHSDNEECRRMRADFASRNTWQHRIEGWEELIVYLESKPFVEHLIRSSMME